MYQSAWPLRGLHIPFHREEQESHDSFWLMISDIVKSSPKLSFPSVFSALNIGTPVRLFLTNHFMAKLM